MKQWIKAMVGTHPRDLTYDEAASVAHSIARGEVSDAQAAAFLIAARMKGETDEEIRGFIEVFRKYSHPFASFSHSVCMAGGHEGRSTFPVGLPVALLLASVGIPVVLQGGDPLLNKESSLKELLAAVGLQVNLPVQKWERMFMRLHIGFLSTDRVCSPLSRLRGVREHLGVYTMLHTVEQLLNPLQSGTLITGVEQRSRLDTLSPLVRKAGYDHVFLVQGIEGSDDLPLHKHSTVRKISGDEDDMQLIAPANFGYDGDPLFPCPKELRAERLLRLLQGDNGEDLRPEREHIVFNAGVRFYWFDKVESYEEGFQLARSLLQRKAGYRLLNKWIHMGENGDPPVLSLSADR